MKKKIFLTMSFFLISMISFGQDIKLKASVMGKSVL